MKPTKRRVVAVNQIWYLICNLINIKSGKISMFLGRCRVQVGEILLGNDKETQWQKPAWVLCLFGGNCAPTPQTNGARSFFPSTQPHSTVQYVTWWWWSWSPIKVSSFCNLLTPGVPCPSPPGVNYPIFAASPLFCAPLIMFSITVCPTLTSTLTKSPWTRAHPWLEYRLLISLLIEVHDRRVHRLSAVVQTASTKRPLGQIKI